jgi:hypothetical protein
MKSLSRLVFLFLLFAVFSVLGLRDGWAITAGTVCPLTQDSNGGEPSSVSDFAGTQTLIVTPGCVIGGTVQVSATSLAASGSPIVVILTRLTTVRRLLSTACVSTIFPPSPM